MKRLEEARALTKHYEEKVEQLAKEVDRGNKAGKPSPSTQARLERNREKLQQAAAQTEEAGQVAQRGLRACADRRPQLADHARALTATMSSTLALPLASPYGAYGNGSTAPTATTLALPHSAPSTVSPSQVSPSDSPNRFNPFAEDDEEAQEVDNSLNPFAAEISPAAGSSEVQSHWTTVPASESSEEQSNDHLEPRPASAAPAAASSLSPWAVEAADTSAAARDKAQHLS